MLGAALSFLLLILLPIDFSYPVFAAVLAPERAVDGRLRLAQPRRRDEQPAGRTHRGAGGGMNQTFQNSAQVLSIGIFFS